MSKKPKINKNEEVSESKKEELLANPEVETLKSQLARTLADYDNLQKRVLREKEEGKYLSKLVIVSRLLPVFDMFTEAQKHLGDPGIGIALKVLEDTLRDENIVKIEAKPGDEFNYELHEAIDTVESQEKDNIIESQSLNGYKFIDGPVIRHAKVKVFKKVN